MVTFKYSFVFLYFLLLLMCGSLSAQTGSLRKRISLDEDWRFHFGHAADPVRDFNYSIANIFSKSGAAAKTAIDPRFDDSAWRKLDVPHDWAVELPFANASNFDVMAHGYKPVGGLFPETSIGWYRKQFSVAGKDSGQRFQLQFDGIFRDATFWLNGFYLGNNKSGYLGIAYDVTDYMQYGKANVLVVRVDATQYEGWFYEGAGIYRHVWLNQYHPVHVVHDGMFAYSTVKSGNAAVNVETEIENTFRSASEATVSSFVADHTGRKLADSPEQRVRLSVNGKTMVKHLINLKSPILWDLENPYLYRVVSLVKQGGRVVDSVAQRFGIRTIDVKPNGVFLNGRPVKIKGTNNHQDHAGLGAALPDYMHFYRVRLLKALGSNAYRSSHNAPAPEILDACDSLGLLVMDEHRLLNSSPEYVGQFERLLKRDRSRASVFMWSIGNEEGWIQGNARGRAIAQTLLATQRQLDPTRVSTYAADMENVFHGINEVIPVRGFNYRQYAVADYHRDHPGQPIIGTEMGSTVTTRGIYGRDTVRAYVPDQDITAPWWASTAETWWKLAANNNAWLGGFIWTGFDYRGEPTPYKWPNISSHFGIMDMCGFPKNIYYYYQSWWTDKDVLHISPHWNWKGKEGTPIDVWVNSNADNVELFLNGKSLGRKDMPRQSHLKWKVNYEPGTLEAVAYKKGRRLTNKVETTGEPFEIVLSPYKTTMIGNGKDAAVINLSVFDREGREVPDAQHLVQFVVKGDARIIGVGNGDPSSHEPDKYLNGEEWKRSLFNGKAQVILQAGKTAGIIQFEAKAEGLQSGTTDIITVHPGTPTSVTAVKHNFPVAKGKGRPVGKMLGADISFLPQLEARGVKFSDKGEVKDAIDILKDHGFNYIRLRIFNNPAADSGYAPGRGFCDLLHTLEMARRVKAAGMQLLLDFHYSDTWADPGKQFKPSAWKGKGFPELKRAVYDYTRDVMERLKKQGTLPDMVQVGNEINHGMIWPEGNIGNLDSLSQLIYAGINGVKAVDPGSTIMLHVALGGQNDESRFFYDNMVLRDVPFDVIGLSFYPKWHCTLADLEYNANDMANRYQKDVIIVEYSHKKKEVNHIGFNLAKGRGKGTCIWEPLNTWEKIFERDGQSNNLLAVYDEISQTFLQSDFKK
ncbi:beta-galactosidase GalA [Niabella yanshanensis]|uniref:Arabinogalactan endo-beta-1,4-galactanase n=1 Tax=Niabella yanshanensis TaxID=577386 RepID=A0ABZ0W3Z5_9BACT|nr:beta-galactosidase GalA [Niabella yanshanensis]WQD38003.1 beta-galactosidase GalA [Niabella yanshanensis]